MSTSMGDHDRWSDSLASWLLGALPKDEARAFAAHLEACPICREDAASLRVAADALPASAPPLPAPPDLKGRIMAVVEREAELLAAADDGAPRPAPARRSRLRRLRDGLSSRPQLALAPLLAVLVLAGAGLLGQQLLSDDVRTLDAQVEDTPALAATQAQLEIGDDEARFVTSKLPAPPQGRVYQLWIARGSTIDPKKRLFTPRGGSATVTIPGSMRGVSQVMVTDEPAGGSPAPTGDPIINVEPA
jgi:anti-sigma factor RsiW